MGYILLWIEVLAFLLLFIARAMAATAVRMENRQTGTWRLHWKWISSALLVVFFYIGYLTIVFVTYFYRGSAIPSNFFPGLFPLTALILCFVLGIFILRRKCFRRIEADRSALAGSMWPRGKLLIASLIALALFFMTFWNLDLEARQKLAALQTEMNAVAFSLEPAKIPDSENAAPIYERAAEVLNAKDTVEKEWENWLCELDGNPPKFDIKDPRVAAFFKQKNAVLVLLYEATQKPGCVFDHLDKEYWPPDFEDMNLQIRGMRQFSRFLSLHAQWEAANGNISSALRDVQSLYRLARHQCSDPLLIVHLLGIAIDGVATRTFEKVLETGQPTADDLERLKIENPVSHQKIMQKTFRRESLIGWSFLSQFAGKRMPSMLLDENTLPFPVLFSGVQAIYRVFLMQSEVAAMREFYEEMNRAASLPYYELSTEALEKKFKNLCSQNTVGPCSAVLSLLFPAISAARQSAARADAEHNTAELALAATRYRLKNGRFPKKLEELLPDYLFLVPTDPFDGKPMKYKTTEKGVVIYSIGPDRVDDGGKPLEDEPEKKGDVTFELLDRTP
jgi:hypothetical protein